MSGENRGAKQRHLQNKPGDVKNRAQVLRKTQPKIRLEEYENDLTAVKKGEFRGVQVNLNSGNMVWRWSKQGLVITNEGQKAVVIPLSSMERRLDAYLHEFNSVEKKLRNSLSGNREILKSDLTYFTYGVRFMVCGMFVSGRIPPVNALRYMFDMPTPAQIASTVIIDAITTAIMTSNHAMLCDFERWTYKGVSYDVLGGCMSVCLERRRVFEGGYQRIGQVRSDATTKRIQNLTLSKCGSSDNEDSDEKESSRPNPPKCNLNLKRQSVKVVANLTFDQQLNINDQAEDGSMHAESDFASGEVPTGEVLTSHIVTTEDVVESDDLLASE